MSQDRKKKSVPDTGKDAQRPAAPEAAEAGTREERMEKIEKLERTAKRLRFRSLAAVVLARSFTVCGLAETPAQEAETGEAAAADERTLLYGKLLHAG